MIKFLRHLLLPHESNNHRPKILHHSSLLVVVTFVFSLSLLTNVISTNHPEVLGITANISAQDLLQLTNEKRDENGLPPLKLNNELSQAAIEKGQDMFAKNYWAHNSPDGLTPWVFIKNSGYNYIYAGENLARGFTTAPDVIDAWMASPGHRENMLSPNYKDIGFAIMSGNLTDDDTVLVVEEFGSRSFAGAPEIASSQVAGEKSQNQNGQVIGQVEIVPSPTISPVVEVTSPPITPVVAAVNSEPLINKKSITKNIPLLILALFLLILILDMFVIERKKIDRIVGHNLDHVIFFGILLITILVVGRGIIL